MSKNTKKHAKLKRLAQKRARRATKQAEYESYKRAGQNKKSKRFRRGQTKSFNDSKHSVACCGNLACSSCFEFSNPWKAKPNSSIFSKRFTSSKWKNAKPV